MEPHSPDRKPLAARSPSPTTFYRTTVSVVPGDPTDANASPQTIVPGLDSLVAVQRPGTANGTVGIHVLPGESAYKIWIVHRFAAFDLVDDTVDFLVTDWNGDGSLDLVAIRNSKGEDTRTRVEILAGATQHQHFLLETDTAVKETYSVFDYAMADWTGDGRPDLVALKKEATKSEMVEVHVLLG